MFLEGNDFGYKDADSTENHSLFALFLVPAQTAQPKKAGRTKDGLAPV